jgi:hypothetical protein
MDQQSRTHLQLAVHQRTSLVFPFSTPVESPRSVDSPFDFYTLRDSCPHSFSFVAACPTEYIVHPLAQPLAQLRVGREKSATTQSDS